MCAQTIYWQDFTLDFREIRWTFGRAWDWANFRESHEKFVRFGNSESRSARKQNLIPQQ